jgi:hypothetical protein
VLCVDMPIPTSSASSATCGLLWGARLGITLAVSTSLFNLNGCSPPSNPSSSRHSHQPALWPVEYVVTHDGPVADRPFGDRLFTKSAEVGSKIATFWFGRPTVNARVLVLGDTA